MRKIHITVREEDAGWSATSPEAPGWTAFAPSYPDVYRMADEGLRFFLDDDAVEVQVAAIMFIAAPDGAAWASPHTGAAGGATVGRVPTSDGYPAAIPA